MGLIIRNEKFYAGTPDEIDAKTVNGHTVESDVPVDAKFTDNSDIIAEGGVVSFNDLQGGVPFSEIVINNSNGTEVTIFASGKNCLPVTLEDGKTASGVTANVNEDNSITVSGATTGLATFAVSTPNMPITTDMRLSYTGDIVGMSPKAAIIRNGEKVYPTLSSTGSKVLAGDVIESVYLQQQNADVVVSGTGKFQLEVGTTVTEYEVYQGSSYIFTPDSDSYVIPDDIIQKDGVNTLVVIGADGATLSTIGVKEDKAIEKLWSHNTEINSELEKGTGILVTTTTPSYSSGTIDGVSYKYKVSLSSVKAENNNKTPIVGAYIYNDSYKALYPVVAISEDDDLIYLNTYTSLAGTNGSTPYVNDYGNWHTNSDTGVAAIPQRMSLRKPVDAFFSGSDYFQVIQNDELTNSNILGIYCFAGYYLFVGESGIEFYTSIEDDESALMSNLVGMVSFSIPAKEAAILYGSQHAANAITIYITDSNGALCYATLDEDSIINGNFEEVSFMSTGNPASAEQISNLCTCNNKLYCQNANGTIFLLPNMGNYNNGRIVGQSESGYTLSSDGRFVYRTDSMGLTMVSLPCSTNNDMLSFIEPIGYQETIDGVCGICDCDDKMIAISMMGIHWAKNDMLQVFELSEDGTIAGSSTTEYQDGVFKPCLVNPSMWNLTDTSRASMKSTESFILMFTGQEIVLYKKNPFTLFGSGSFNISYGESISSVFETNNKLYIFKKNSYDNITIHEISLVSPQQPLYMM